MSQPSLLSELQAQRRPCLKNEEKSRWEARVEGSAVYMHVHTCAYTPAIHVYTHTHKEKRLKIQAKAPLASNVCQGFPGYATKEVFSLDLIL